jgi:hypothetical protein
MTRAAIDAPRMRSERRILTAEVTLGRIVIFMGSWCSRYTRIEAKSRNIISGSIDNILKVHKTKSLQIQRDAHVSSNFIVKSSWRQLLPAWKIKSFEHKELIPERA